MPVRTRHSTSHSLNLNDNSTDSSTTSNTSNLSPSSTPTTRSSSRPKMGNGTTRSTEPKLKAPLTETDPLVPHTQLTLNGKAIPFRGKHGLLTFAESHKLLPWQSDNEYITGGYRRQLHNIRACIWSAIGYVHNETVNIHTHSIGALFFAILGPVHVLSDKFPNLFGAFTPAALTPLSTNADKLALAVYCASAVGCLTLSSWFHTVCCANREVCDLAHSGDYVGIVVLIVGSILPGLYYGFDKMPALQAIYMLGITAAGLTSAHIVLSPHHRAHRWHRTLTFIALGLSAVVPVTHVILSQGLRFARDRFGFTYVAAGGASYIFGALLYAARFPEKQWPGKFNLIGSSHNIFHCFVLLGAWFQYSALRWMVYGKAVAA